jgi:protein phosphatase
MAVPLPITAVLAGETKPRDDEIDLFGLTHPGKVRRENQDHFLIGTVHPQLVLHGTSLPATDGVPLRGERVGTFGMVADGVGGSSAGAEASRIAVETITRYVNSALHCFTTTDPTHQQEFVNALRAAAQEAHQAVRTHGDARPEQRGLATTLTLAVGVWPRLYILQVGDSRCYYFHDGVLEQVTRDQTVAQDLVDRGILRASRVESSPFKHVLASAIGGGEATPVVSTMLLRRGGAALLCSDGLTKHVGDAELAERLGAIQSAEQCCRDLLALALERGGTDNITILIGRSNRQ